MATNTIEMKAILDDKVTPEVEKLAAACGMSVQKFKEMMAQVYRVQQQFSNYSPEVIRALKTVQRENERIAKEGAYVPTVRLFRFNENDITYTVKVWCENGVYWDVYFDLLENIREAYDDNGIEFSYPHRVVRIEK